MNFITDLTIPDEITDKLRLWGNIYKSIKVDIDDASVSTHPDIQIHFINDYTAVCAPKIYEYYKAILPTNINVICGKSELGKAYPENCAYNVARIGKFVFCNTKFTENGILSYYERNSYEIVNVKQGYTKCNICVIDDSTFITEDRGIYNTAKKVDDLNPILIEPGGVLLDGFDYGFIGGATGKQNNTVLFCGSISKHKNFKKIDKAIKAADMDYVELSDLQLTDYGSIISFR